MESKGTETSFGNPDLTWASALSDEKMLHSIEDTVSDEISRFSRPLLTFAAVMTIVIMIVGIVGNLLTIFALIKCPKVRNVAAAFLVSLCLADCLFCAVVLPFSAFRFIRGTWTHGDFLCRVIPLMQYGNIGVSLLCIAMITTNRYIMIAHHNAYAKIYKRHWIGVMILFCWIFSYGMQMPTFFNVWGTFGYDSKLGTCSILPDENGRSSKTVLFVIAFVIPCLIIVGCYAKIFWVVHQSELRLRQHARKQNSIPNNMRHLPECGSSPPSVTLSSLNDKTTEPPKKTSAVKDQRDTKVKRNEWRITKMVLAIFLSFIVCYLPITVVKVADKDVAYPGFHILGYIMLYLSACINPIIYVIMNKQYRQAYKTVLMCKPSRLLGFTNAGSSAAEKWKDAGSSYNHSRTMVSQVSSIADANTNSNPQQLAMELKIQRPDNQVSSKDISTNTRSALRSATYDNPACSAVTSTNSQMRSNHNNNLLPLANQMHTNLHILAQSKHQPMSRTYTIMDRDTIIEELETQP